MGFKDDFRLGDSELSTRRARKPQCPAHFQPVRLRLSIHKNLERLENRVSYPIAPEHEPSAFVVVIETDHHTRLSSEPPIFPLETSLLNREKQAHSATIADDNEIHVWGDHRKLSCCGSDGREEPFGIASFVIAH
jgi:hypothetical protein